MLNTILNNFDEGCKLVGYLIIKGKDKSDKAKRVSLTLLKENPIYLEYHANSTWH